MSNRNINPAIIAPGIRGKFDCVISITDLRAVNITPKRRSINTPPTYISTCVAARKSAIKSPYKPAIPKKENNNAKAEYTKFLE